MQTCTGKRKDGQPCGMRAGKGGLCVNHGRSRSSDERAASSSSSSAPATPRSKKDRALIPGEKPAPKPAKRRRSSSTSNGSGASSSSSSTSDDAGASIGELVAGLAVGLGLVAAAALVLFRKRAPPSSSGTVAQLRPVA